MFIARRSLVLLVAVAVYGTTARAQAKGNGPGVVSLALTYDALGSNLTTSNRFWMQGGAAELNADFFHGFGATASVLGLHQSDSGGGVPVNLVIATFGPSYTYSRARGNHSLGFFARGLVGEADGFRGVYPQVGGASTNANSLAVLAGGGVDVGISRHLAVRVVQADYLRTQLPNSLTNVQNSLRLGAGIVLR